MWEPRHPPPRVVCQLITRVTQMIFDSKLPFTTQTHGAQQPISPKYFLKLRHTRRAYFKFPQSTFWSCATLAFIRDCDPTERNNKVSSITKHDEATKTDMSDTSFRWYYMTHTTSVKHTARNNLFPQSTFWSCATSVYTKKGPNHYPNGKSQLVQSTTQHRNEGAHKNMGNRKENM